jgi:hypothetical protein
MSFFRFSRGSSASTRFRLYVLFACGLPLLLLVGVVLFDAGTISVQSEYLQPKVGENSCFMTIKSATVFFYLPILVMLCFNMVMFVKTIYMLKKSHAFSRKAGIPSARISKKTKGVSEKKLLTLGYNGFAVYGLS